MSPTGGPCLCGDTQCPSCGPAQGNSRCVCGEWQDDHSYHEETLAETGDRDPTCKHDDDRCFQQAQAEAEAEAQLEEQLALQHEDLHGPDCRCY